ncbi:hypothetical protein AD947_03910 [Acetobacter tropicalis]|uniref:Uncharacterized protein n=1 Tax=Acetobacter tropicalis TaxID=104102 RepID=A0A149U285_9PROT|nr:hypothetical protein [Acetobacter tropicalis]KXV59518.1 hypothetical protein AD947_03910 [Acetobacter tropicalis]
MSTREKLPPDLYWASISWNGAVDNEAIIGFDRRAETFFCQAFEPAPEENADDETPRLWMFPSYRAYPTFDDLLQGLAEEGATLLSCELTDDLQKGHSDD